MSKLPRPGGIPQPKVVKSTSTRTVNIPGTNKTVTQTQTTVTEVQPCPTDASTVSRGRSTMGAGSRCPPPAPCGIRTPRGTPMPPSGGRGRGLRPPSAPAGPPGQPGLLAPPSLGAPLASSSMISPGMRPPATPGLRPPATPGLRPPGASGLRPPGGAPQGPPQQRPATPAAGGSPCPATCSGSGLRPPGGRPPAAAGSGLRPPAAAGSGLRSPAGPSGLRPPSGPSGLRAPSAPASGLRTPTTSASGLRPPSQRPQTPAPSQGAGPCTAPCSPGGRGIPQAAAQRGIGRPGGPPTPGLRPPGSIGRPGASGLRPPGSQLRPPQAPVAETTIEEEVQKELLNKSALDPEKKVSAKSGRIKRTALPEIVIDTPAGPEKVIQQAVLEKRVERDEEGERIVKNLSIIDTDKKTGQLKKIEMGLQQMDPKFTTDQGKEVLGIVSKVSITPSYTTVTQECTRAITELQPQAANMTVAEIASLVEQEKEDVENTLKMLPPELEMKPGKIDMKKRLQNLRLNSESMALLEQSIINPEPEADEAQSEPSPEMMAAMMHTVEKGVPPQSAPEQVFNALFTETTNEKFIQLSPVTHGPLQDVVVPTKISYDVHKEIVCEEIEILTEKLQNVTNANDIPPVDIFTRVMEDEKKSPTKGKAKDKSFPQISDEKSLWVNANLERLVNLVGAEPVEVLDPANVEDLETSGTLEHELSLGIEYYVDVDPVQYMSRVQLRGTQEPNYFPGYLVALPDFPEVIKLARSPDEVFASAWKSVQPKYFPDESMQSMIY